MNSHDKFRGVAESLITDCHTDSACFVPAALILLKSRLQFELSLLLFWFFLGLLRNRTLPSRLSSAIVGSEARSVLDPSLWESGSNVLVAEYVIGFPAICAGKDPTHRKAIWIDSLPTADTRRRD